MNKIPLIIVALLAACTTTLNLTPQVQQSKQQQEQNQTQSQSNTQTASTAADQQSSHASDSKQGLSSQPVIVICNSTNSPNAICSPFETAKDVFQKPYQPQGGSKK